MERRQDPDQTVRSAEQTAARAQELAEELGSSAEDVREHLGRLPTRYAAAVTPRTVVRHALMAATPPGATEVRTRVTRDVDDPDREEGGADALEVVALDNPGWFAKVAGVIALHGGEIVQADAFARDDGIAVDTFRVCPQRDAVGSWWARVEGDLVDAAAGRLALRARLARATAGEQGHRAHDEAVETSIRAAADPDGWGTRLEVRTRDRTGVLYAITSALAELEVDIVLARIETVGDEAADVFVCRNGEGQPLDPDHLAEVELAVTTAVDTF